jgi:thioesterase domain-containing protein
MIDSPLSHLSPVVELRPGDHALPVFMVHGMGGSVLEFSELIKYLQTSSAIYGLQAKGSDGTAAPLTRIEHIARFQLDAIKKIQPHGPYRLIGYSLGGLVALEMAHLMAAESEPIGLLVMIDSYPYTSPRGLWEHVCQVVTQAEYWISDVLRPLVRRTAAVSLVRATERARFSDFLAWTRYQPRSYDGEIKFVRAADSNYLEPAKVWPSFAARLKIEIVPGDHHTLLSRYCENLARLLSSYLGCAPQRSTLAEGSCERVVLANTHRNQASENNQSKI